MKIYYLRFSKSFSFLFYAYFWIFYCVLKFVVPFSQYFRHFTMWKFTQNPYFLGFLCNHLGLCYHYVLWLILILTHSGSTYLSPMGRKWSWYFFSHPREAVMPIIRIFRKVWLNYSLIWLLLSISFFVDYFRYHFFF